MPAKQLLFRLLKCIFGTLIIKAWMAQIGAVNIANGSGIIHCQCCGKEWEWWWWWWWGEVEFDYSAHTMAGCLMIPLHLGTGVCRLQALAVGDTGLAKC